MSIIVVLHLKVSIYSKQRLTLLRLAKIVTNGMFYVISRPPLGYVYTVCITYSAFCCLINILYYDKIFKQDGNYTNLFYVVAKTKH